MAWHSWFISRWFAPGQRPSRAVKKSPSYRLPLRLEQLESRTVPTITITRTSTPVFYNDFTPSSGPPLTSAYASYQITNNNGVNYTDVWATIDNFTSASGPVVVTLAPGAPGAIDLGPLANGQTKTAFFYLQSTVPNSNVAQTHTVRVFNGPPASGALLTSQNFSFTSVQSTLNANANVVTSVVVSPSTPTVGQPFTITVTGQTGSIGTGNQLSPADVFAFTPASFASWRADALQLVGTTITFSPIGGSGNTGTFTNILLIPPQPPLTSNANSSYTAVYTFVPVMATTMAIPVSPVAYIRSGNPIKHTDTGNFTALPPIQVNRATPRIFTEAGPTVLLGGAPLTDSATLADGFNPTGTITFTLTGPGGGVVYAKLVTVNGNGTYTTSQGTNPGGFLPTVPGVYQWVASYSGDNNNHPIASIFGDEPQTVNPAEPTLTTSAGPTVVVGSGVRLTDSATLTGGFNPTGTITFTLTGPAGGVVYINVVTVNGNGTYSTVTQGDNPGGFLATVAGTYQWVASYSGDDNNDPRASLPGDEPQRVDPAAPTMITSAGPTVVVGDGTHLTDSATLAVGFNPTGTITFTLEGPGGGVVYTNVVMVNGNGTYDTSTGDNPGGFLPTVAGTYQWVASYSGDGNNHPIASPPGDEPQRVDPAAPTITTSAGPTVTLGGGVPLTDSATLAGGFNPGGTITFTLEGPNGLGVVYTNTVTVNGNGTYDTSTGTNPGGFLPTVAGTYQWVASYSGDDNNHPYTSFLGDEPQVVTTAGTPTLTTSAGPSLVLGDGMHLTDAATLAGDVDPTGTITFYLFSPGIMPDNPNMPTNFTYRNAVMINGNGTYDTSMGDNPGGFLPSVSGDYQWLVIYSGDTSNPSATSTFGHDPQRVNQAAPTIVTSAGPTVTLSSGVHLTDSATLANGFNPGGTITFTLTGPDGSVVYTNEVMVNGSGTYDTSMGTNPGGFLPTVPGTYQWVASYSGDDNNHPIASLPGDEPQMVDPAAPTITTRAGPTVTLGDTLPLTDEAMLAGGVNPGGMITFTLTGPSGGVVYTTIVTVNGNGTYDTTEGTNPGGFHPTVAGTYQWVASYSGDDNNHPIASFPGDEPQTVNPAAPTIITSAGLTVVVGSDVPLTDAATLAGGFNPGGTITFTVTGPDGVVVYTNTVTVNGNGTYTTSQGTHPGGFLPTVPGTYQWVASYSGDANNHPVASDNGDEPQTVIKASPTITTSAGPTVLLGSGAALTDSATLANGFNPTGTITFTLARPDGAVVYTNTVTVNGNGTYTTSEGDNPGGFVPTVPGTYQWVASYSGDANNHPIASFLGDEPLTARAGTTISTTPIPKAARPGTTLQDEAVLAGGFDPTGTIFFNLYEPGVDPAAGNAVYTEEVTVAGNGTYRTTMGFAATTTGIWHWVAEYSGDATNTFAFSGPLDEPVNVRQVADIALTKVVQPSQVMFGHDVTYTLMVHNNGPDTATNVFVDDPLPRGVVFVSATASQGTFAPGSGIWVVGTLAVGVTAVLHVTVRVDAIGPLVNRAEAGADQFDPDLANNRASATLTGLNPAPIISKRSFLASSMPDPAPPARPAPALATLATLRVDIAFLDELYLKSLGRDPKPAELAYWMNELLLGVSRSVMARRV
jgi:uncharacterized repeat protein (TIGR01451 family)